MTISGSTATTTATDTSAAAAMKKSIGLNKDDFLKLFISELKYQDPLKPQDPTAMLDQLSQLSLVEQSYNSNTALTNLLNAQNSASTMNSVSFIGKNITANGNAATFDGTNPTQLQFAFSTPVDSGSVTVMDAAGNILRTIPLGATLAGDNSVIWDGRDSTGALLPAGSYSFKVSGTLAGNAVQEAKTYTTGRVDGISISNGSSMLTIGGTSVALSDIIKIKGV